MNDNKKIALNTLIILIKLIVTSVASIISARLVLDALGASDYGLYNVVGGIVAILNVVNTSMVSTTYRYIAYELGKGKDGKTNKVFNASSVIHCAFALLIIILGLTVGEWYIHNHLNVEYNKIDDAHYVFIVSLITAAISTALTPYRGVLVAYEKFGVSAVIEIFAQLLRLGAIIILLSNVGQKLKAYSFVMMGYTIFECICYVTYSRIHFIKTVKTTFSFDTHLYKEMLSFASWTMIGAAANVAKIQGCTIILNLFFGTVINAAYAVANQVENFILMFARSLNNAAIPQITKSYSGTDYNRSLKLTAYISKYTFFLMSLIAFPLLLEIDFFLKVWLKVVPVGTSVFCKLLILTGLLGCLGEGISAMVNATGRIRIYQIVINLTLLLGLPISYIMYKAGADVYTVSIVYCIIYGVLGFLKFVILRQIIRLDTKTFFNIAYWRVIIVSLPLIIYYMFYNPESFTGIQHILGFIGSEIYLICVILCFGIDRRERNMIKSYLMRIIQKHHSRFNSI